MSTPAAAPVRVPSCSPVRTCRPIAPAIRTPGVWHFDSGVPGKRVMLSALIHGNELCGAWALRTRWPPACVRVGAA